MTKTDATHYYFDYTVGAGDGAATVALSVGTDLMGNVITSAPTSGATFTVDNTAPTIVFASLAPTNGYIDIIFSEGVYGAGNGTTALTAGSLALTFSQNGGTATGAVITSVKKNQQRR